MTIRVLVVDDDEDILRIVRLSLLHAGFEVIAHDSAFGVGALVLRHRPDVLVSDVSMPGLDGEGVAAAIARAKSDIPIIFHSALSESELKALTSRVPGSIYVMKGSVNALVAAVRRHARASEPSKAAGA